MAYSREEVLWAWLLVVLSKYFLVTGTAPAKKKGFSNFTYVIVYNSVFTAFESFIVYRNTPRPCYLSKRAAGFESSDLLHLLKINGHVGAILT